MLSSFCIVVNLEGRAKSTGASNSKGATVSEEELLQRPSVDAESGPKRAASTLHAVSGGQY